MDGIRDEDARSGLRNGGSGEGKRSRSRNWHSPLAPLIALEESRSKEQMSVMKLLLQMLRVGEKRKDCKRP